ncbi:MULTISPECIES: CPBP family intramembrane glutamic endopeptidase [unclassified Okeania]|uniref:CPBP family intramembrane glutamic endopeptidase n=1 Tax=unclassified Okeania TaxID=2634635 RepID=UPI0013BC25F3|nr:MULTISPECIES: CPBP family intramembrane glutamic endopeptidase [unclassified Okeania]NES75849.1 CPBP family intramembrane metalloprotease [Okeania sp. SIO1H4]NET12067.1 CPBP family intramembrane metalloprotease [Okeania sp. SIO1H6]NET20034.1 CPBP family intramembrane metalloprotease [Okeania sp. SIO1H5]NET91868.1 CPBP family intramembrane metalloprotease [Okeania sp. SIO1H2]
MTEQIPENPEIEPLTRTQVLVAMGVTALVLLAISKTCLLLGVNLLPVSWNPRALLWGVAIALGITIASSLVYRIWPTYRRSADQYLKLVVTPLLWPDLIWLGLLPGLSEELLFRGVILSALGLDTVALIASSIFFGVLHLSGKQQWPYMIWAIIVGMVLGYSALATGNLLIPIIAHILTNLISSSTWKWEHN